MAHTVRSLAIIVIALVMMGLLGLVFPLSLGGSPHDLLPRLFRYAPAGVILLGPLLAAFPAMVLLWWLLARGLEPIPSIVLTTGAWCVLTLAVWFASIGFWWFVIAYAWGVGG